MGPVWQAAGAAHPTEYRPGFLSGDRSAALLIQASAEGLLDFRHADLSDRRFWIHARWVTDALHARNLRQVWAYRLQQHLAIIPSAQHETAPHWDESNRLISRLFQSLFPWQKPQRLEDAVDELVAQYDEVFGPVGTPEAEAEIDEIIRSWENGDSRTAA